jgi:hypothetical protein
MTSFDAARTYVLWNELIADEELYRTVVSGRTRDVASSRSFDDTDVAILEAFAAERGTRWNIENLRFRCADEVAGKLQLHLPRTMALLTRGVPDWSRDLVFEYCAYHRWQELGHYHLAECDRFATYVDERIAKRRALPAHLHTLLHFEQSINRLVRRTATLTPADYPKRGGVSDTDLARGRPRLSAAAAIIELDADISEWIRTGDPLRGEPGAGPIVILATLPSPTEPYRIMQLSDGARYVLDRCTGEHTGDELAATLADDADGGFDRDDVFPLLRRWAEHGSIQL